MSTAPLVQLDTSSKYYKSMVEGMLANFKKAVNKATERAFSQTNVSTSRPIHLIGPSQQRVGISEIQIDGLSAPKVSNVFVNKKNMKLHVTFTYKTLRVSGRCSSTGGVQKSLPATGGQSQLLEASNWSTSWSAGLMQMVGRDHFDLSRVYTSHSPQRLSLNLRDCPQAMHEKLKAALVDRVKSSIDSRLVEIMETVMVRTDTLSEEQPATTPTTSAKESAPSKQKPPVSPASKPKERGKRASVSKLQPASQTAPATKTAAFRATTTATTTASKSIPRRQNPIVATAASGKTTAPRKTSQLKSTTTAKTKPIGRAGKTSTPRQSPLTAPVKGGRAATSGLRQKPVNQQQQGKALRRTKRQTPCQPGEELDDYVDQLFRFGTRIVRAMEPITLPNATIELPDYNLKIFLYEGRGTRAYKFRRTKPAWVFCSNETISLGITIEVEELRVAYKYRVISGTRLLFDGDLEARLSPKVQAQFSQAVQEEDSEEPVQQRIDRVRVFRLGRVNVLIRGLGNLTQSLSMLINSYLNDNQEELQPTFRMVEGDAVRLLNRMLANVNVPLLSVV